MTNNRDSFIFYRSFYQSAKKLPKESKAEIFDAICSYALDRELIDLSVVPEAIFTVIQPQLDANRRKWENGCKEKKTQSKNKPIDKQEISKPEAKNKQTVSKPEGNVNDNVNVECKSESKLEIIIPKPKGFTPPTLEEVKIYCNSIVAIIDPQEFIDYYKSNGWKVGKNAMKDWEATIRSWNSKAKKNPQGYQSFKVLKPSAIDTYNALAEKYAREDLENGE